mmetsp:Transcript_4482/g.6694  ORF Transcript_4482/g.6694 Transcript_4482/m.6694 type:complete len:122 (-) Transcript_4482:1503-1868(-)
MKHGYGEFTWSTGSKFKGNYIKDKKKGYGEMHWSDSSIYRGYWDNGVQDGLGMMIFSDGMRKAGFFKDNLYNEPLLTLEQFLQWENDNRDTIKLPEAFRQEIKEYLGQLIPAEENYDEYLN